MALVLSSGSTQVISAPLTVEGSSCSVLGVMSEGAIRMCMLNVVKEH